MLYASFKVVHILAVVMFLGNITTGLFWKRHADRTRDARIVAHTLAGIIASDRLFTMPGVIVIVLAGVGAAMIGGLPLLRTGWIFWALVLFTISGIVFGARVVPLQRHMAHLMGAGETPDWAQYHRLSRAWEFWGAVALLAPVGALLLMVMKPLLPGL
jgi:uncharacterized membrane protein